MPDARKDNFDRIECRYRVQKTNGVGKLKGRQTRLLLPGKAKGREKLCGLQDVFDIDRRQWNVRHCGWRRITKRLVFGFHSTIILLLLKCALI